MATRDTYTKVHEAWEDRPNKTTPVYAEDLEHIEQGIKDAADKRALKEIYDDAGAKIGQSNTITSVNEYIVNGNGNTLENGSGMIVNGNKNNVSGYGNSISGMTNTIKNSNGTSVEGYRNKVEGSNYSHISGVDNKAEEGDEYAVFMHGSLNECRGSSAGAVFGTGNILKGNSQFVAGKYSKEDEYKAFIVGGGTSDTDRKNIYTLDLLGNATYAGDVRGIYNGRDLSLSGIQMEMESRFNALAGGLNSVNERLTGVAVAKVFDTKAELDEWLAADGNLETLKVGQNIYIAETGTPDYWWDGTGLQVLETDKVEIASMTYDETMAILNATAEEVE